MRHVVLLSQTLHSAFMMRQQVHQEHGCNTALLGTGLPLLDEMHHADHDLGLGQHLYKKLVKALVRRCMLVEKWVDPWLEARVSR
jgi:hypothetical protein